MKSIKFIVILLLIVSCATKNNDENLQKSESKNEEENVKHSETASYKEVDKIVIEKSIDYLRVDTAFFPIDNKNPYVFGHTQMGNSGWGYADVINDSILFAYDDFYFNMKLLNIYTSQIDTVVEDYVNYNFHSFTSIRGEIFRHADNLLYRFDNKLNLKDSFLVSESLSENYSLCDFVEDSHSVPNCITILYPKGYSRTKIKKEELTEMPYLERVTDSTLRYGINFYKVKQLPKNTTFIFQSKNKIYSVYILEDKYMLLIYTYDSIKGY